MKQTPNLCRMEDLSSIYDNMAEINGKWVPARPMGFYSIRWRLKLTWMVFTGKADALKWPEGQ